MEACWAHNPEVVGSKPTAAIILVLAQLVERGIVVVRAFMLHNIPTVAGSNPAGEIFF